MDPMAIMKMAGHADFKTTLGYIQLSKVSFGREVAKLAEWYGTAAGTKNRYEVQAKAPETGVDSAIARSED